MLHEILDKSKLVEELQSQISEYESYIKELQGKIDVLKKDLRDRGKESSELETSHFTNSP